MLDVDLDFTGFISVRDFEFIIQRIALVNSSEIQQLMEGYDPTNTGSFNYFTLLSDLCGQTVAPAASARPQFREEPVFEEPVQPRRPSASENATPRASNPDDYAQRPARPSQEQRLAEIVQTIASTMQDHYDSSTNCFHKWRGMAKFVGPAEFVAGAKRDFKIDVTTDEAAEIIAKYGGTTLSLGTFTKMIGAGSSAAGGTGRKPNQAKELDDDEKWVMHIARQAKGKQWEDAFRKGAGNVDMLATILKKMSIFIMAADLKPLFTKYGIEGLIDKISEFIDRL
jgi:hypothetical protein